MDILFDIIIPYRDRQAHLDRFLPYYASLFPQSTIYIIEQANQEPFNRAWLLNVGALLSNNSFMVFQDVDMMLCTGKKLYSKFPDTPTQLATHVEQFGYRMPFPEYFGGATSFSREDFRKVNGFSNNFSSWGAEDCEMYDNVKNCGLSISYRECYFSSLPHKREFNGFCLPKDHPNYIKWKLGRQTEDGLSYCNFKVVGEKKFMGWKATVKHYYVSTPDTRV